MNQDESHNTTKSQLREDFSVIKAIASAGKKKRDKRSEFKARILNNWGQETFDIILQTSPFSSESDAIRAISMKKDAATARELVNFYLVNRCLALGHATHKERVYIYWADKLRKLHIVIKYVPGNRNKVADGLSRTLFHDAGCEPDEAVRTISDTLAQRALRGYGMMERTAIKPY